MYDTEYMPETERKTFSITTPCNWLQIYENTQDPIHVLHLHARSGGVQFGVASGVDQIIEYKGMLGMMNIQTRQLGGHVWTRTTDSILPNGNQQGLSGGREEAKSMQRCSILRWMVPVDDTTTRTIGWRFSISAWTQEDRTTLNWLEKSMILLIKRLIAQLEELSASRATTKRKFPGSIAIHALERSSGNWRRSFTTTPSDHPQPSAGHAPHRPDSGYLLSRRTAKTPSFNGRAARPDGR